MRGAVFLRAGWRGFQTFCGGFRARCHTSVLQNGANIGKVGCGYQIKKLYQKAKKMGYNFEIFFSYKRNPGSNAWHAGLKESLAHWVSEELEGEEVRIFFDVEDINAGAIWKNRIVNALCSSKCLVAVWSPEYFVSKYCVAEWLTFDRRSKLTSRELIAPASRQDGKFFPTDAKALQIARFNEFALVATKFWETPYAADFEVLRVKPFARDVAKLIRQAPDFVDNFPVVDIDGDLPETALLKGEFSIRRIASER